MTRDELIAKLEVERLRIVKRETSAMMTCSDEKERLTKLLSEYDDEIKKAKKIPADASEDTIRVALVTLRLKGFFPNADTR